MQCYPRAFGPRATLHNFRAKFFSVDLGTSQYLYIAVQFTLTNVTRSSSVSTTSVIAKYSRTFLQMRMILRTSDSSNESSRAEVPCKMPAVHASEMRVQKIKTTTYCHSITSTANLTQSQFVIQCCIHVNINNTPCCL